MINNDQSATEAKPQGGKYGTGRNIRNRAGRLNHKINHGGAIMKKLILTMTVISILISGVVLAVNRYEAHQNDEIMKMELALDQAEGKQR